MSCPLASAFLQTLSDHYCVGIHMSALNSSLVGEVAELIAAEQKQSLASHGRIQRRILFCIATAARNARISQIWPAYDELLSYARKELVQCHINEAEMRILAQKGDAFKHGADMQRMVGFKLQYLVQLLELAGNTKAPSVVKADEIGRVMFRALTTCETRDDIVAWGGDLLEVK